VLNGWENGMNWGGPCWVRSPAGLRCSTREPWPLAGLNGFQMSGKKVQIQQTTHGGFRG